MGHFILNYNTKNLHLLSFCLLCDSAIIGKNFAKIIAWTIYIIYLLISDVRNAFKMYTPRREWICSTDTDNEKLNWTTLLEHTIRTALGVN